MSQEPANPPRIGTLALHAGQTPDPTTTARAVPIYATTSYVFHDTEHAANLFGLREFGNIYTRLMNPTTDVLEKRLTALDGGAAGLAFSSGQAAITASLLTIVHAGQNFISANSLYGGTWTLFTQTFSKLGIEVRFFDPSKPETLSKLVDKNTRAVYIETPGNPKNDVPDYRKITNIAHGHGLPTIIDNTALTAALFRPIEHGFDIVVYSTTKFIGGHGVHIGGAIVDSGKFPWAKDPGKWPEFTAPDPAYHGLIFEEALRPIGNIAYIIHQAKDRLPLLTERIVDTYAEIGGTVHLGRCPMPTYNTVVSIIEDLKSVLFPGYRRRDSLRLSNLIYHVGNLVDTLRDRHGLFDLTC